MREVTCGSNLDYEEAKSLFGNVREPNDIELQLERVLQAFEEELERECVRIPEKDGVVVFLNPAEEGENARTERSETASVSTAAIANEQIQDHGSNGHNSQPSGEGVPAEQGTQDTSGEASKSVSS
jgi:hypothetical protein